MDRTSVSNVSTIQEPSGKGQDRFDWSRDGVPLVGYLLLAMLLFIALAVSIRQTPYGPVDLAITRAVQSVRSPMLDAAMQIVGQSGFFPQVLVLNALFILILYVFRLRWAAVTVLAGGGLTGIVSTALRHILDQPRPSPDLVFVMNQIENGHYSFPSGHVTGFVAILGFFAFLGVTRVPPSWHRNLVLALYALYLALVGVSRIYVGEHWPNDVLGGYLLGSIFMVLMILFYQWGKDKWPRLSG